MTTRKEQQRKYSDMVIDGQPKVLTKVETLDHYLDVNRKMISGKEICKIVHSVFKFDLSAIPVLNQQESDILEANTVARESTTIPIACEVIDSYLAQYRNEILTGAAIRSMINHIFGVNLAAISALEGSRISLFSKGQWIIQHENDLFAVQTGAGDVDVKVFTTKYFAKKTGLASLPIELQLRLIELGFHYQEKTGDCYFSNPTREAVPDAYKGKTIGTIIEIIKKSYLDL